MLVERIVLGALMIAALLGIVAFDFWLSAGATGGAGPAVSLYVRGAPVTVLATLLIALAAYEMAAIFRVAHLHPVAHWAAFVSAGLILVPWIEMQHQDIARIEGRPQIPIGHAMTALWLMGGVVGTVLTIMARKKTERAITAMATTLFIIAYLGVLGSFLVRIRCLAPGPAGAALLLYSLLTIKAADIGAYFTGRLIGRHKLAAWLSPNKTIEGFLGANGLAALVAVAGMLVWHAKGGSLLGPAPLPVSQAIIFGIVMAIMGHLGDLAESLIKRDAGVKHSSHIIPSFGGLLDILDSPLFAAPAAWWLLTILGRLG